jgi:hypothetical protein
VYHVNMPLSCIDLFRLNAYFIRGFILSEWIFEWYIITCVFTKESKGNRPISVFAAKLHAVFLIPKMVLQYLWWIFSKQNLSPNQW